MAEKILMLALSPTMETGTIARWNKKEGDRINNGDIICEVETDKATMDYESIQEGILLKILVSGGEQAAVGDTIAIIGEKDEDISNIAVEQVSGKDKGIRTSKIEKTAIDRKDKTRDIGVISSERIKASPLARKMAEELNIDIHQIQGTGPGGRIIKRDVESISESLVSPSEVDLKTVDTLDRLVPASSIRKTIARRMTESKFSAPHFYLKIIVKMDELLLARHDLNTTRDNKVSLNGFLVKFIAETLKRHPRINSSWNGEEIIEFGSIDIGIAIALQDGLVAPVVRNCDKKGIIEIDNELKELVEKAYGNKLVPEDYTGATFTVSNLGSYGIDEFTAIINPPGSAILAIGKINRELAVDEHNEVWIEHKMKMTMSCDHRVIDGAVGALFLNELKGMIENPVKVLY